MTDDLTLLTVIHNYTAAANDLMGALAHMIGIPTPDPITFTDDEIQQLMAKPEDS